MNPSDTEQEKQMRDAKLAAARAKNEARRIAHAKLKARLDQTGDLPQYIKDHPVLYAGPAKTPEGMPCGSMGPTTANRMDPYVDEF